MPPPTVSGRKISLRHRADGPRQRLALLERGGDVEDHHLVDAFDVVAAGQLAGVAGVAQLLELHALHHLAVAHVEARDDALGQHQALLRPATRPRSRKLRRICRPASLDFSGWNCTPKTLSVLDHRREGVGVRGGGGARARHRRRERVREVDLRARVEPGEQARRLAEVERVPADVRNLQALARRRRRAAGSARAARPGRGTPGASSLPSNSHCMPTQMPRSGVPAAHGFGNRVAPRAVEHRGGGEVADARHDERRRARRTRPASRGVSNSRAQRRERLAHRRQVAGAVVDERNHRRLLTAGPSCSAASSPAARPSRTPRAARGRTP